MGVLVVGLTAAISVIVFASVPAARAADWARMAESDLNAMHDLIQANHPGPVDTANPDFNDWLNRGETSLLPMARAARYAAEYRLVLRDYANGFADGHLGVSFPDHVRHVWPGFLTRADAPDGAIHVSVVNEAPGISPGAELLSCDGVRASQILQDRVLRPLYNPHVPQRLPLRSAWLIVADADDAAAQFGACTFKSDGRESKTTLHWRTVDEAALTRDMALSAGFEVPQAGLTHVGDVWLISLPTFFPQGPAVQDMQALMAALKAKAGVLHAARHVVIDLRGNDGGSDEWGDDAAAALWGRQAVDAAGGSFATQIEWRVSPRNLAAIREDATRMAGEKQADAAQYFDGLADRMAKVLAGGQVFMRESSPATSAPPRLPSPFAHPVYILTTPHCASACLDFLDVMTRLPGAIRIGLPTSSDTDYLEMASANLPSGHATLKYAMKVYRERTRAANESYQPTIPWKGAEMTDASIAAWVDTLP